MCSRNISFCITYLNDLAFFRGLSFVNSALGVRIVLCVPREIKQDHDTHIVIHVRLS